MNNYMNNSIQYDNNNMLANQQTTNIYPSTNTGGLFNQPSSFPSINLNGQTSVMSGMSNDTFNNQLDPVLFNGTTLDDDTGLNIDFNTGINTGFNTGSNGGLNNITNQDPTLIKSVAREIINGLKENNMSLYDNSSINSYKNNNVEYGHEDLKDYTTDDCSTSSKSKNKVKEVVETIEDFVNDVNSTKSSNSSNSTKSYSDYVGWFFDECFNYKDFLILFILYFVLSQEMIKDFFSKYFSSLNPDDEGKIGVQGVIIYGLVLTILFMVIKKLF
jgi:hypothetical protein